MTTIRIVGLMAVFGLLAAPALADDITDAIEQARKAYQGGDLANAKQSLDLASQLIGQKNAESFATLLPNPLPGWKAEKPQAQAMGAAVFGASVASRSYSNAQGESVEVQITGDSADAVCPAAGQSAVRRCDGQDHQGRQPARHSDRGWRRQLGHRQ